MLTADFEIELKDPCDPPLSLVKSVFTDTEYTITDDDAVPYTHPAFVINPDYCPFNYAYEISDLSDKNGLVTSAITQDSTDEKKFSFYYD